MITHKETIKIPFQSNFSEPNEDIKKVKLDFLKKIHSKLEEKNVSSTDLETIEAMLVATNDVYLEEEQKIKDSFLSIPAPTNILMYLNNKTQYFEKTVDGVFSIDIYKDNLPEATFYFDESDKETLTIRTDYVESLDSLKEFLIEHKWSEEQIEKEMSILHNIENKLKKKINEANYSWHHSHNYKLWLYAWYDIKMKIEDFDILIFEDIWRTIGDFDTELKRIHDLVMNY